MEKGSDILLVVEHVMDLGLDQSGLEPTLRKRCIVRRVGTVTRSNA